MTAARTIAGTGLLAGVKVVDVGHVLAGPMTSSLLSDFGAEVIHVERPRPERLPTDAMINRGKLYVTLDLRRAESRGVFRRLVTRCDVLTENLRPERMEEWGYDWPALRQINPRLVYARLSGFGLSGPRRNDRAYGMTGEAFAGWAWLNGYADGPPLHSSFSWADTLDAQYAAMAIVMALHHRERSSGRGQLIDQGLFEPLYRQIEQQVVVYDQTGHIPSRMGSQHEDNPYQGVSRTSDGVWFSFSATTRSTIAALLAAVGLGADSRFDEWATCEANRGEFHTCLSRWFGQHTLREVEARFEESGACGVRVMNAEDLARDPQIAARQMIVPIQSGRGGAPVAMQGVVPKFSATPGHVTVADKAPGQDNEYVYRELLGISDAQLHELEDAGVV